MTTENDLDKKFQEDLEKARALSLETLALEKFKLKKLQEEKKKGIKTEFINKFVRCNLHRLNFHLVICIILYRKKSSDSR